ncbi:FadR/GntR family transcriptional regulator [Rhodococcus jostii]|uniref:FadR/GntR family transcriptional regulator n=1 Tax=Rhodococcus jostii TaxID=132919 RepID=UPI003644285B
MDSGSTRQGLLDLVNYPHEPRRYTREKGKELKPVGRKGLVDQIVDRFEDEIVSGRWAVGSRIPTEPMLAEMVGTGRNTVREAVQVLRIRGCSSDGRGRVPMCCRPGGACR